MDEINRNVPKTFVDRVSAMKYVFALAALVAIAAAGYTFLPESRVSAQTAAKSGVEQVAPEAATQAMIDYALNLRSASEYTVYAEKGIVDRGDSEIRGTKADAMRSAESRKSTKALSNSIDAMRQLPCTEVVGGLSGKTFGPGVYCVSSVELAGEMVIDGQGSAAGAYIFRVQGTLNAKSGSSIRLENGAQGGNVYFVAENVEIGENAAFRANVLTDGDISIKSGATVTDKVMALGKVELDNSALLGGTTGSIRICVDQQTPVSVDNSLSNRVFHFVITGTSGVGSEADPLRVAVGACSDPVSVTAGPRTVTELTSGSLVSPANGTFEGNFELTSVVNLNPASSSSLGSVNLATRKASINIATVAAAGPLTLRFTNRRAITGFIEICKRAATGPDGFNPAGQNPLSGGDPDVTGFFQYTIKGIYSVNQQYPDVRTLQVFTIPVGQCTGPITVTAGGPAPFNIGSMTASVTVSELPRQGTYFERTEVMPSNRRNSADVPGFIVGVTPAGADSLVPAPGGGYVNVLMSEAQSVQDETLIIFENRSNPGRLKVCKVAGPGVPLNTLFQFTVSGIGALDATHPQISRYGAVTTTFNVRAGDPAHGGTCEFVPGLGANAPGYNQFQTFVNGTPITIVENGISPDNQIPQNPGQIRVSQIRAFQTTFTSTDISGFSPNPDLSPADGRVARASVTARAAISEVEFSGFRFNPTTLKVCKIGLGSTLGQSFNFTIALVSPQIGGADPGPMFPTFSTNVNVTAGPQANGEGNCTFVNASALQGGAFNQGSTITVTEGAGGYLETIACPTCDAGGLLTELPSRRATITGPNGLGAGINSLVFTNSSSVCRAGRPLLGKDGEPGDDSAIQCTLNTKYDFDGDRKADPAVFTPSTGMWLVANSNVPGQVVNRSFGVNGDRPVAADYDADGITDFAVWRESNGRWYFQGSTGIFEYHQWGEPGDIPQAGDYDGDGKSDFGIFRPSNSTWYIKTRNGQLRIFQFGAAGDVPFAADYDGDGRTDAGIFRNGTWYTQQSTMGFRVVPFGQAGDIPVPADYDGDGAVDYAVFRGGTWYKLSATTYTVSRLGQAGDIPVPADYDGDGRTDIATFRASEGGWYLRRTFLGEPSHTPIILGGPGDVPAQAPYWVPGLF